MGGYRCQDMESDPEDEIHSFRRVHIKAREKRSEVQWSAINKHPLLLLDRGGLQISLTHDTVWPNGVKGLAVHADRPFDHDFLYFELTILDDPVPGYKNRFVHEHQIFATS